MQTGSPFDFKNKQVGWGTWLGIILKAPKTIPHICHLLYTGKIFQAKILHPKARKLRQIEFRDKIV